MIDINLLRSISSDVKNIVITQHMMKKFKERDIKLKDTISAIQNGEIIEQYPTDFPFPSCLVLGKDMSEKHIHIVCGTDDKRIFIITAYYPSEDKWGNDFKTRKA